MLRLAQQLVPALPGGQAKEVVRAALGLDKSGDAAGPAWSTCLGRPAALPDMAALLARRSKPTRPVAGADTGSFTAQTLATPAGSFTYKLFRPDSAVPPTALVVMLHGCTQDADDFAAGTGMNALAQRDNLLVVYPEQSRSANMSRCWNWFVTSNQKRDSGEAAAVAAITRSVMAEGKIAPGRVLVAGLSAGGAMAAIMAETYPELFGAVGIHSGLAFGAAHDVGSAFAAMRHAGVPTLVEGSGPLAAGVPTIVFHGDADATVDASNAAAIVARVTARDSGLTPTTVTGQVTGGRAYTTVTGRDAAGGVCFESWTVKGGGHAWSGGQAAGTYTDPKGPDASDAMLRFFRDQIGAL